MRFKLDHMHTLGLPAVHMLILRTNVRTKHPYRQGTSVQSASSMPLSDTHVHTQTFNLHEVAINTNINLNVLIKP